MKMDEVLKLRRETMRKMTLSQYSVAAAPTLSVLAAHTEEQRILREHGVVAKMTIMP